jgi:hypothetical protein
LKIARIARTRQNGHGGLSGHTTDTAAEINDVEIEILNAREADLASSQQQAHGQHPDLLHLNEAIHSACVLIFYARLRDLVWTAPVIRKHVEAAVTALSQLNPHSRTSLAVLFPYYHVGCEAVDSTVRKFILERLAELPKNWFGRASRTAECLRHIWEIRDEDPGAPWIVWNKRGSQVPLVLISNLLRIPANEFFGTVPAVFADCIPV